MAVSVVRNAKRDEPAPTSRLSSWAARRPLTAFLVLTFTLAYSLVTLVFLSFRGAVPGGHLLSRLPIPIDEFVGVVTLLSLFPAALYVTWASEGGAGVRRLLRRATRWRVNVGWWLLVLLALPALTAGSALLFGDSLRSVDPIAVFVNQLGLLAVNFIVVNLWEETAWAGFLQTRLERRHNLFVAAVLTAVPFAFLHLPLKLFLGPVTVTSLLIGLAGYFAIGLLFRPMIGVFLRGARDSELVVAVLHSVFNRTNNENGIVATLVQGDARGLTVLFATLALTAGTAVAIRHRLTRAYRRGLDSISTTISPPHSDRVGAGTAEEQPASLDHPVKESS
jgi:membrane protease YdiL (CAAX protease family)